MRKFLDLNGLEKVAEKVNKKIPRVDALPASASVGDIVIFSFDGGIYRYDGTQWVKTSGNADAAPMLSITWSALKSLRDVGGLIPGMQYRITDFVTTTAQADTRSAGHAFDVIVMADDTYTLNENARACLHEGDSYFSGSNLKAWKIKYSLDNDSSRFVWASPTGKGVIWFMQDEHGNVAPYDFKNIKFKRYKITNTQSDYPNFTNKYYAVDMAMTGYSVDSSDFCYFYTFSNGNTTSDVDISLKGVNFVGDFEEDWWSQQCLNNVIMPYLRPFDNTVKQYLNNIVFQETYWNTEEDSYCSNNTFGESCYSNTFGASCYSNTFGASCSRNTFDASCYSNTFGESCYSNTFGAYCYSNTFGAYCSRNTFGESCSSNTFGASCSRNTFGASCSSNTFGAYCYSNTFGAYYRYNHIENGCFFLNFSNSGTLSSYIQKARVFAGTQGQSAANKMQVALTPGWVIPYNVKQTGTGTCSISAA